MYQTATKILNIFFSKKQIFKHGFNLSPMYRRSTGKIVDVSKDLMFVKVKIPLSYKNKNYVGSIFGGSLFSATDPIYMVQLINILGENYVVWDKDAQIKYKRPAKTAAFSEFHFTIKDIEDIKTQVSQKKEINITKRFNITSKDNIIFAEVEKTIYIAEKIFYKKKKELKK